MLAIFRRQLHPSALRVVEAFVRKDSDAVVIQWAVDGAFRFFLLVHGSADLPALHAFDLAKNRALALRSTEVNTRWQKDMVKYFVKTDPTILGPQ